MAMTEIEQELARLSFFEGLDADILALLARYATERRYEGGSLIFRSGDAATHFYVIRRGSVSMAIPALYGPPVEIQNLEPGAVLGWSWLIPPHRWFFEARTIRDTEALAFDGVALRDVCERDPRIGYALLKRFAGLMAQRVQAARLRVFEVLGAPSGA
jgi:CRP/FNR family transcriptional regulator, cyclic AMP receptor protein